MQPTLGAYRAVTIGFASDDADPVNRGFRAQLDPRVRLVTSGLGAASTAELSDTLRADFAIELHRNTDGRYATYTFRWVADTATGAFWRGVLPSSG